MAETAAEIAQKKLESVQALTEATSTQRMLIVELLDHPGMSALLGLLLAEKQGYLVSLQNLPAGSQEQVQRLGVVQGRAAGIDRIREVILECASVPTNAKDIT